MRYKPFTFMGEEAAAPIPTYPTGGLLALYNPAAKGGYSTSQMVDLSGNGNILYISGSFLRGADKSITFYTGSYAYTTTDLSSSLVKDITVISFKKIIAPPSAIGAYGGTWYIGGTLYDGSNTTQIFEREIDNFSQGKIGYSTKTSEWLSYVNKPNSTNGTIANYWADYANFSDPTYNPRYSFLAYEITSSATISGSNTNTNVFSRGWTDGLQTAWFSSLLENATGLYTYGTAPNNDNYLQDEIISPAFTTMSLDLSGGRRIYINPYTNILPNFRAFYGSMGFVFGGFAVYDRVLDASELEQVFNYFTGSYGWY
jgi:hypothetical protein